MAARIAHIIPGLSSHSLMSVVKLCDAGCKDEMEEFLCEIKYNGITIIKCRKWKKLGLWMTPLTDDVRNKVEQENNVNSSVPPIDYGAYQTSTK